MLISLYQIFQGSFMQIVRAMWEEVDRLANEAAMEVADVFYETYGIYLVSETYGIP